MLRNGIETHLITSHFAIPLMLEGTGGLVVEVGDGKRREYWPMRNDPQVLGELADDLEITIDLLSSDESDVILGFERVANVLQRFRDLEVEAWDTEGARLRRVIRALEGAATDLEDVMANVDHGDELVGPVERAVDRIERAVEWLRGLEHELAD